MLLGLSMECMKLSYCPLPWIRHCIDTHVHMGVVIKALGPSMYPFMN